MAKRKGNKMANQAVAATGLRVISMYVQEYFHWGWQPYGQENDDGIDGVIIPRYKNGEDMGVRIFVQSKSGPGYLRPSKNDIDFFKIQPYNKKEVLNNHIDSWHRFHEPVILVYTNAEKENKKGNKYLDLKNPVAWWVRMDDYKHDGSSEIKIPRENLFQEHTKGVLNKMIKPNLKEWIHNIEIKPTKSDLCLWNSLNLKIESKKFYKKWAARRPSISLNGRDCEIKVSRTGWRHINNKVRKERVVLSLKLLPIAQKILMRSKDINPVILRSRNLVTDWESFTQHIGYRARVQLDGVERKVQVVVKRYKNVKYNIEKFWFYSVHIVK